MLQITPDDTRKIKQKMHHSTLRRGRTNRYRVIICALDYCVCGVRLCVISAVYVCSCNYMCTGSAALV